MTGDQEVTERTQLILTQAFEDLASGGIIAHHDIFVNPYDVIWKMNQLFLLKSSFFKEYSLFLFSKNDVHFSYFTTNVE